MRNAAQYPLFHGTSVRFAKDIKQKGANARILKDIGAFRLAEDIVREIARSTTINPGDWIPSSAFPEADEADLHLVYTALWVKRGFQYGALFASLSFEIAKGYAMNNPHGSEYLRAIAAGLRVLKDVRQPLLDGANPALKELLESPHEPAIVEIRGISLDRLQPTQESPSVEHTFRSYERLKDDPSFQSPWAVKIEKLDPKEVARLIFL